MTVAISYRDAAPDLSCRVWSAFIVDRLEATVCIRAKLEGEVTPTARLKPGAITS